MAYLGRPIKIFQQKSRAVITISSCQGEYGGATKQVRGPKAQDPIKKQVAKKTSARNFKQETSGLLSISFQFLSIRVFQGPNGPGAILEFGSSYKKKEMGPYKDMTPPLTVSPKRSTSSPRPFSPLLSLAPLPWDQIKRHSSMVVSDRTDSHRQSILLPAAC